MTARQCEGMPAEEKRLEALRRYATLDSQETFERITHLVTVTFDVPIAQVNFIGATHQHTQASQGHEVASLPREKSFCNYTIQTPEPLVVPDAQRDARFSGHPLVEGPPHVCFYAGAPLSTPDGYRIGTVCFMGSEPRAMSEAEQTSLTDMAELAMEGLELRHQRATASRARLKEENAKKLAHSVIEGLPGSFHLFDRKGQLKRWNSQFEKATGYGPEEIPHMHPLDFFRKEDRSLVEERIEQCFAEGTASVEAYFAPKEGPPRPYLMYGKRLVLDGEPHLVGMGVDISDRKKAETALRESEEQFRTIAKTVTQVFWVLDTERDEVLYVSPAFEEVWGRSADHFETDLSTWKESIHPDDRERVLETRAAAFDAQDARLYDIEFRIIRPDGAVRWVRDRAFPAKKKSAEHVVGVTEDITERKHREEALRQSERKFRDIMENARDIIFQTDAEGRWTLLSSSWEEIMGYTVEQSLGDRYSEYFHREHRETVDAYRERVTATGDSVEDLVRCRTKDGSTRWLRVSSRVFRDEEGAVTGGIGTLTDVTDTVRFESERELRKRTEELLEAKTSFLNAMSHELRTPLASILGFAEVLAEEGDGQQQEFAEHISASGRRLQKTLDSVLRLAQLDGEGIELDLEVIELCSTVKGITDLLKNNVQNEGLTFEIERPEEDLYVSLDEGMLHRILDNLVGNAIKFTDEGGITVRLDGAADQVHLQVMDTGIGISETFQPKLFDDFSQESTGLGRTHEGSGLGLAITKRLVELMDGTIDVESEKGGGTIFTVSFPRLALASPRHAPASDVHPLLLPPSGEDLSSS